MAVTLTTDRLRVVGNIYGTPMAVRHYPVDSTGIRADASTVWVDGGVGLGSVVVLETHADGGRVHAVIADGLVTADTDDRLDVSDHFSATGGATTEEPILGVSLKDCTGLTAGDLIPVAIITRGTILEGNLGDGIVGTATAEVAAAAHIGCRVGLLCGGTVATRLLSSTSDLVATGPGVWTFTLDVTSGVEFIGTVLGFTGTPGDATTGGGIGDTNARVQVVWSPGPNITLF
jgi:hypothetical protein